MSSELIITSVEKLQSHIVKKIRENHKNTSIYISLNKTQKAMNEILNKEKINTKNIFFIDCVTDKKEREDVLYIFPTNLDELYDAIETFLKEINEEKYLIIDALSTLLIYNDENKVASFIKRIVDLTQRENTKFIALSPITKGEDLLNKIFNFFDKVYKEDDDEPKRNEIGEEWIY